jgi:hypothetical protein
MVKVRISKNKTRKKLFYKNKLLKKQATYLNLILNNKITNNSHQ